MTPIIRLLKIAALCLCCAASTLAEPQAAAPTTTHPVVVMTTSMGVIKVELYPDRAPVTVANFLEYVNEGFYDGTIFHRVIAYFMIQGGGMGDDLTLKPNRDAIVSEADNGLNNERGTIAMARTQEVNSARSQFFINVEDNNHLNYTKSSGGYTVFGKVIAGLEVVDNISMVETRNLGRHFDLPVEPIMLISARLQTAQDKAQ